MVKKITLKELDFLLSDNDFSDHANVKYPTKNQIEYLESTVFNEIKKEFKESSNIKLNFIDRKKKFLSIEETHEFVWYSMGPELGISRNLLAQIDIHNRVYVYGKNLLPFFEEFCNKFSYPEIVLVADDFMNQNIDREGILDVKQLVEYSKV